MKLIPRENKKIYKDFLPNMIQCGNALDCLEKFTRYFSEVCDVTMVQDWIKDNEDLSLLSPMIQAQKKFVWITMGEMFGTL